MVDTALISENGVTANFERQMPTTSSTGMPQAGYVISKADVQVWVQYAREVDIDIHQQRKHESRVKIYTLDPEGSALLEGDRVVVGTQKYVVKRARWLAGISAGIVRIDALDLGP